MYRDQFVSVIIPTLNEEASIGQVLADLPEAVDGVIVADNGSHDSTRTIAERAGTTVTIERERGYGATCLRGMQALPEETDIVLFIDGDYSDYPEEATLLLDALIDGGHDMVIGSRMIRPESRAALPPVARFGNWLSTRLIRLFWGTTFTDLGPFRVLRFDALKRLNMQDRNFGWTVEMQIKAARNKMSTAELPVRYRKRIGESKISGTVTGSFRAGTKILYLIFREVAVR